MMRWTYWGGWLLFRSAGRAFFRMRVRGASRAVREGPALVVANHESFLDPPLIGTLWNDEMHFLARKSLFRPGLKWLYRSWNAVPVDQDKPDMTSLKTIIRLLKQGHRVLIFPEGARTTDGTLGKALPGVGLIAAKAGVPIQPVRIRGARDALPRGSCRLRFARIELHVGEPVTLGPDDLRAARSKDGYQTIADRLMAAIAEL